MKRSERWKNLERETARILGGKRLLRGEDFSKSEPDVLIPDFPWLKIDCKAYKRFAHHALVREIVRKYSWTQFDIPVLVTKHEQQRHAYVTIPIEHYAALLDTVRKHRKVAMEG